MSYPIQPGSRVTLHYTLTLADGTVVDSTEGGAPATFVIGSGELVDFLEGRLLGLETGTHWQFAIDASETRGQFVPETVQRLPRTDFPADMDLKPGEVIGFETPGGEEVPGLVLEVTDTEIVVDFSHPLAGRDLVFDVEIVAVEPA